MKEYSRGWSCSDFRLEIIPNDNIWESMNLEELIMSIFGKIKMASKIIPCGSKYIEKKIKTMKELDLHEKNFKSW